jgi:hypothetical protein
VSGHVLSDEFTFTKCHLGGLLCALGVVAVCAALGIELFQSAPHQIGTLQLFALAGGAASVVIGLTLIPLGDRPA